MSDEQGWVVCQVCYRTVHRSAEDALLWLIAPYRYHKKYDDDPEPEHSVEVVRCPQHITAWSLRMAGLGRGKRMLAEAERRKAEDTARNGDRLSKLKPLVHPFPTPEKPKEDFDPWELDDQAVLQLPLARLQRRRPSRPDPESRAPDPGNQPGRP